MNFDTLKEDLLAIADTGLKFAKNKGADQAEIYVSSFHNVNINNQAGMIEAKDGLNEGIGVRIAIDKKLGFAAMSGLTDEAVKHAVKEAISVCKNVKQENIGFESFIGKQKPGKDGIIDKKVISLSTEDIVKKTNEIYLEAKDFDKRIISPSAQTQIFYGGHAVVNSEGMSGSSLSTVFVIVTFITAAEGQKRKSAFDFKVTRSIPEFAGIGANAAEKAVKLLASKPLGFTGVIPTLWNQNVMSNYWQISLLQSIDGRQVVEKNSYFMDKLGDKVGIDTLNITDDGQLPEGLNTGAIDDEGAPRQTTSIIKDGILRSFLYDSYYGRLGKAKSTGNASRAQAYESTPVISPTTVVINPGTKSFDDIISGIDKGIYVMDSVMGMGHSNLISGDFSVVATSAYLIEKGEIVNPLEPIQIAGNLYKSYQNILEIGSDSKLLQTVKTPSILFDGFTVVG
ncbi:MAG TPA: TldD/PmbA family protein [candidate division Zixibacteria bacterium]|nr:TldD/PmbA family protein [candidate division Zixibacteria bacterium]